MTPDSPQLEASQWPSVGEWINKPCVPYLAYRGTRLWRTPAIKGNINTCNTGESQKHYAEKKTVEHKRPCTTWLHLYAILEKKQNYSDRKQICVARGRWGGREGMENKWARGSFLAIYWWVVVIGLYTISKICQTVYSKLLNFFVHKHYLDRWLKHTKKQKTEEHRLLPEGNCPDSPSSVTALWDRNRRQERKSTGKRVTLTM